MSAHELAGARRFTPLPDAVEQPFWDAAARGVLALQRCTDCASLVYPPAPECDRCLGTSLKYEDLSGLATVYSAGVVRSPILPGLDDHLPVVCAMVSPDEDEDVLLLTNVVGIAVDAVTTGTRVRVCFDTEQATPLPLFTAVENAGIGGG